MGINLKFKKCSNQCLLWKYQYPKTHFTRNRDDLIQDLAILIQPRFYDVMQLNFYSGTSMCFSLNGSGILASVSRMLWAIRIIICSLKLCDRFTKAWCTSWVWTSPTATRSRRRRSSFWRRVFIRTWTHTATFAWTSSKTSGRRCTTCAPSCCPFRACWATPTTTVRSTLRPPSSGPTRPATKSNCTKSTKRRASVNENAAPLGALASLNKFWNCPPLQPPPLSV